MSLLYGMHDAEGAKVVPSGGWCVALVALSENPSPVNYTAIRPDINWLVRVNWGYGSTGTIPLQDQWPNYLNSLHSFVRDSRGVTGFIIGNEPNHEQERPNGVFITPEMYAQFFSMVYQAIKTWGHQHRVAPAPLAPYHASHIPWTDYARRIYSRISKPDFLAIHAYLRSSSPDEPWNTQMMDAPLQGFYFSFLSYLDSLSLFPPSWHDLPVDITEIAEMLPNGWDNRNTGVVKNLYRQLDWHNQQEGSQKIRSASLYRFPTHDKWSLANKPEVLRDFQDAVTLGFRSPVEGQGDPLNTIFVPSIQNNPETLLPPSVPFQSDVDPRVADRVKIETTPNDKWFVKRVQWFGEGEAGGRHHVYVETLDRGGSPVGGVRWIFGWPTGANGFVTTAKRGFDAANQPFSPGENAFWVKLEGGPKVSGLGMGVPTPSGFNPGTHASYVVTFQEKGVVSHTTETTDKKDNNSGLSGIPVRKDAPEPVQVGELIYPVKNPLITQHFGENPQDYIKYGIRGHNGVDFAVPEGVAVWAVDDGVVIEQNYDAEGYGLYQKLRHPWGESLYAHLSTTTTSVGKAVKQGEVISLSGNSGNSTGPHLHFALRVHPYDRGDGMLGFSDPMLYLPPFQEDEPEKPEIVYNYGDIISAIRIAAQESKQDWALLASLAWAESSFRPYIQDGLFQLGEATWKDFSAKVKAKDINNPLDNARVGAAYYRWLLNQFGGDHYTTLIAWNFGIGNVLKDVNPPTITKEFANKVMHGRDLLHALGI